MRTDVAAQLGDIQVPTLFLAGSQDRLLGHRSGRAIAAAIPRLELVEPHLLLQTQPAESTVAILKFLAKCS
jgi:pimeloyl-ACP methyl ester carboxylesterase